MTVRVIPVFIVASPQLKLIQNDHFVNRLQQSRTKFAMNGNGRIRNYPATIVLIHALRSWRLGEIPFFKESKNVIPVSLATLLNYGTLFVGSLLIPAFAVRQTSDRGSWRLFSLC